MPQLHLYVSEEVANEIRRRAEARGLPVSRYLGELVAGEISDGWPDSWFERVLGGWKGETLERPDQGTLETRDWI